MRDIIVQLKMIQCGYFGPAEATAGAYIASHRKNLGSYFENSLNNEWPYQPLHRKPNELETQFNEYLMKMTEELSNGTLKNISILDLPSFGSHISGSYLDKEQTSESNWPNELNFAIYNQYKNDTLTPIFVSNISRSCLFHNLSATINCWSHQAWNESDEEHIKMYTDCTNDLADSSSQIMGAICHIQDVALGDYSAFDFWLTLQQMDNDQRVYESRELGNYTEKIEMMAKEFGELVEKQQGKKTTPFNF